jgi:hypothetical protein
MTPKVTGAIIFATVFLIAFAAFSPLFYIARVDARHIERALNEHPTNQP